MSTTYTFSHQHLETAFRDLFLAAGSPAAEAEQMSRQLIKANLTGHDSHGIIRITMYLESIRKGFIKCGQSNTVVRDSGAAVVLSGNWGYGQIAASQAMELAIERARTHNIVAVGITDLFHVGRLADYAVSAANAGMVGMVFTSGGGFGQIVAPFGGAQRRMGTNPMAVGFPSDRGDPVVFDMATSAYAEGKFRVARDAHKPMPEGVLIDKEGKPSTRTEDLYEGGAILPLGGEQGYKGYLLNFLVEVMAGVLTDGGYLGKPKVQGLNNCTMFLVLNVESFRVMEEFKGELNALIDYLKATPPLPGQEVLAPGEVEARTEAIRSKEGIPLAEDTVIKLQAELDHYKVPHNLEALAQAPAVPAV